MQKKVTVLARQLYSPEIDLGGSYSKMRVYCPKIMGHTISAKGSNIEGGTYTSTSVSLTISNYATIVSLGASYRYILLSASPNLKEDTVFYIGGV